MNGAAEDALRASEEIFHHLVDGVEDYAIFMLDATGHIVSWNTGAERIKGYAASEIIGQHYSVFFPPEDVEAGKPMRILAAAAACGRVEDEGSRVRKDGSRFWANALLTALHDESGELRGFAKVTRDITERRKAETLRVKLIRAREAVRLRDEFLAIASHELKTPLTPILIQADSLLQEARADAMTERVVVGLERIRKAALRLNALITQLLDVSVMSAGRFSLHRERVDLAALVGEVALLFQEQARRAGSPLVVIFTHPVIGTWDPLRIG